ncbi:MAG: hypothetical protein ACPGRW_06285 [Flavobacteriaceae bacterium]
MIKIYELGVNVIVQKTTGTDTKRKAIPKRVASIDFGGDNTDNLTLRDDRAFGRSYSFAFSSLLNETGVGFATKELAENYLSEFIGGFKAGGGNGNGVVNNYNGQAEIWDLYSHSGSSYSYTPVTSDPFILPNDGVYNNNYYLSDAFNTVTNQLDLSSFFVGSNIELTLDFDIITASNNQEVELRFYGSVGHPNEWFGRIGTPVTFKSSGTHGVNFHVKYPLEFQSDIDFPAEIRVISDGGLTITPKFLHIMTKTPVNSQFADNNLITGDFFAGVSQTVYADQYVTIYWDSFNKQFQYEIPATTPLGAWNWHDAGYKVTTQAINYSSVDDIDSSTGVYYFTNGGVLNTSANATGFGAVIEATLTKEAFVEGFPAYEIKAILGDINNVKYKIIKIK